MGIYIEMESYTQTYRYEEGGKLMRGRGGGGLLKELITPCAAIVSRSPSPIGVCPRCSPSITAT